MKLPFDPELVPKRFLPQLPEDTTPSELLQGMADHFVEEDGEKDAKKTMRYLELQWRSAYSEERLIKAVLNHQLVIMRDDNEELDEDAAYLQARGTTVELWNASQMYVNMIRELQLYNDEDADDSLETRQFRESFVEDIKFPWEKEG